jgi:hypothetical protein
VQQSQINPQAFSALREKVRIRQRELTVQVSCSLSAVPIREAGRSSPGGYRLRRRMGICPDEKSRNLFFALLTAEPAPTAKPPRARAPGAVVSEGCYLEPNFVNSLTADIRKGYREPMENILQPSHLKVEGKKVAAKGFIPWPKRSTKSRGCPRILTRPPALARRRRTHASPRGPASSCGKRHDNNIVPLFQAGGLLFPDGAASMGRSKRHAFPMNCHCMGNGPRPGKKGLVA